MFLKIGQLIFIIVYVYMLVIKLSGVHFTGIVIAIKLNIVWSRLVDA